MDTEIENTIKEKSIFKYKLHKIVKGRLTKFSSEHGNNLESETEVIVVKICELVNLHSKSQRVLNRDDKEKIARLENRAAYLTKKIEENDESKPLEFYKAERSALRWAVNFIKEHSL